MCVKYIFIHSFSSVYRYQTIWILYEYVTIRLIGFVFILLKSNVLDSPRYIVSSVPELMWKLFETHVFDYSKNIIKLIISTRYVQSHRRNSIEMEELTYFQIIFSFNLERYQWNRCLFHIIFSWTLKVRKRTYIIICRSPSKTIN